MKTLIEKGKSYVDFDIYTEEVYETEFTDDGDEIEVDKSYDYIRIDNLFVDPSERGKGLARQLLNEAVAEIKKHHPELDIKIVAEPKESGVDQFRLAKFYESINGIDEVVAV